MSSKSSISQPSIKVECHAPKVVHHNVKTKNHDHTEVAHDLVKSPIKVKIQGPSASNPEKPKTKRKGVYVQSRYRMSPSATADKTLSTNRLRTNTSGAKTSTPSSKREKVFDPDVSDIRNCSYGIRDKTADRLTVSKRKNNNSGSAGRLRKEYTSYPKIKRPLLSTALQPSVGASKVASAENKHDIKSSTTKHDVKSSTKDSGRNEVMLNYNRYLQLAFMLAKFQHARKQKTLEATRECEALMNMRLKVEEENQILEEEIMKLRHLQNLRQQLEEQNSSLASVNEKLPNVQEDFLNLTENLDATCNALPLVNICSINSDKLEVALNETKQVLGEANILIQSKVDLIEDMKTASSSLAETLTQEEKICSESKKIVSETSKDLLKLTSLQI